MGTLTQSVYESAEYRAFVRAIRAAPGEDLPRLVCADWLEERREVDRVGWIRHHVRGDRLPAVFLDASPDLSWLPIVPGYVRSELPTAIEYTPTWLHTDADCVTVEFDRGFASRVSGPLVNLIGGECGACGGERGSRGRLVRNGKITSDPCPQCHGTGRTPGILRELVKREPVLRVEATDREPQVSPIGDAAYWRRLEDVPEEHRQHQAPNLVPAVVFDLLECGLRNPPIERWGGVSNVAYSTPESAHAALSDAILKHVTEEVTR